MVGTPHPPSEISLQYTLRRLTPADAAGVADCVLAVHGDRYPRAELLCPEQIIRRNDAGEWISVVALDATGAVVGHAALEPAELGPIAEMGMSVVRPEHQRRGLLESLRDFLLNEAGRLGLAGQFVEVGTVDTAAQAVANRAPIVPCGLSLSLWPSFSGSATMRDPPQRLSFLRYFRNLEPPSPATLYAPPLHHQLLVRIYEQLGMPVTIYPGTEARGTGRVMVEKHPAWQYVLMTVPLIGADTLAWLEEAARSLRGDRRWESAYLELPVSQPGAAHLWTGAERLGFFFSNITPHLFHDGAGVRLQWLRKDPEVSRLRILHPFARELLAYIEEWRRRTSRDTRR